FGIRCAIQNNDTVFLLRLRRRDETAPYVLQHALGLALQRIAPPAGSGGRDPDDVARLYRHHVRVAEIDLVIGSRIEQKLRWLPGVAALAAPGREERAVAVARGDHGVRRRNLELQSGAGSPTIASSAAGIRR